MINPGDIDSTAAEYVLGTLDRDERIEVASLRFSVANLDATIIAWENRLAPLNEAAAEATPSADLFLKIERRILMQPTASDQTAMTHKLNYWRGLALAASLALVVVSGVLLQEMHSSGTTAHFVAVLQKDSASPAFLVSLNEKTSTLIIRTLAATPPADKSYELWLVAEGVKAPRSLGVLPAQADGPVSLAGINPAVVRNATLAVSLEPLGGSPTGAPTGPVVFSGKFVKAAL